MQANWNGTSIGWEVHSCHACAGPEFQRNGHGALSVERSRPSRDILTILFAWGAFAAILWHPIAHIVLVLGVLYFVGSRTAGQGTRIQAE